jgi:hypothetical protein
MTLEERLIALEERLDALERENRELRKAAGTPRPVPPVSEWRRRTPDEMRQIIERDLTPMQRAEIHQLALDTQRYGYDQAMIMHGRKLPKRGRSAA